MIIDIVRILAYNFPGIVVAFMEKEMEYLSIRQTSERWGLSIRRIQVLCSEGRIPGAVRIGYAWAIPRDAEKPNDARIKTGKYVKNREAK